MSDAELIFDCEWHQTGGGGGVSEVGCGPPLTSDMLKVNTSPINSFNELTPKKGGGWWWASTNHLVLLAPGPLGAEDGESGGRGGGWGGV